MLKVLLNLLAAQTKRPLRICDPSEVGQDYYIVAAKAAFKKQYAPRIAIISQSLTRARQE
jgi:hypothetical protein